MRFLGRALFTLIVLAAPALGAAYWYAGTLPGPQIDLRAPEKYVGRRAQLEFSVDSPKGEFSNITAVFTQDGTSTTVFSTDPASQPAGEVAQQSATRIFVMRPLDRRTIPGLKSGPATITVTASRPVLYGLRTVATTVARDLEVRLDPPRVGVLSLHHFVNHGGPEFVVFRVDPADAQGAVRVGTVEYPAYPGEGVGIADPGVRVAFFALGYDQDRDTPIAVVARDVAGNEAAAPLDHRVFPRTFARSRIEVDDRFLSRVVPAIAQNTPDFEIDTENLLKGYLAINNGLRRANDAMLRDLAAKSRPEMQWRDAFAQLGNTSIESRFADYRTYFYNGQEIDRQVHLGFDLASVQRAPVSASNRGIVLFAGYLGIYGNCVVIDHGLGVQTLYAHLSEIGVREGQSVEKGETIGRTGTTGLAGGDHLHFSILINGTPVSPIEMWDPHWMEDRVFRKIREAGGRAPAGE